LSPSRSILVLLGSLVFAALGCGGSTLARHGESSGVSIDKRPVDLVSRTFDPASPPSDMPPLSLGEEAECDSNFLSDVNVGGQTQKTDATHAFVTITQIKVSLRLHVTIWTPTNVSPQVIEHEQGHRQIAEHYYQTAGELARRIASEYTGEKVEVTGTDLSAESSKLLQRVATEITNKYNSGLNPEPTQLLYDSITDHGRNEVVVKDAVASAIKNVVLESPLPPPIPGN
jgi:hypothetical protein